MTKYYNNQLSDYQVVELCEKLCAMGDPSKLKTIIRLMTPYEVLECVPTLAKYGISVDIPRYVRRLDGYHVFINEQHYRDLFRKYGSKSCSAKRRFDKAININRLVRLMYENNQMYDEDEILKILDHSNLDIERFCRYIVPLAALEFGQLLIEHGASRELVVRASGGRFKY